MQVTASVSNLPITLSIWNNMQKKIARAPSIIHADPLPPPLRRIPGSAHSSLRLDTRLQLEQYRKRFWNYNPHLIINGTFERAISILHIDQICAKHGSLILTFIVGILSISHMRKRFVAFPLNAHPTFTPLP